HLFMVSEWSAHCSVPDEPASCVNALQNPVPNIAALGHAPSGTFAWTDLTYLLHRAGVSWRYYVAEGSEPDCDDDAALCPPAPQKTSTPSIWNPLPLFTTVREDSELVNIQTIDSFEESAKSGDLPAVAWIVPNAEMSEHPTALVSVGQAYVTSVINAIMQSP